MMTRSALLALLLASSAAAQTAPMGLLSVRASAQVPARPAAPRPAVQNSYDATDVLVLGRVIAAEAGGNDFSNLAAKTAVGAAVCNKVKQVYGVAHVRGRNIMQLLQHDEPGYLSSLHDGNRYLFTKNAAWLRANGFSDCLLAATRALVNQDPSNGATNWYDSSIDPPYSSRRIAVTARVGTDGHTLVFYRFR